MTTDKKIVTYKQLGTIIPRIRKGKTVVAVTGTFDLFHAGHLMFLNQAKKEGDILVVGVGSDRTVKLYKGDTRPILPEELRTRLIAGFEVVDYVVLLDEEPLEKIGGTEMLKLLSPDKWVVPYQNHNPAGDKKFAKILKTKLVQVPRVKPGKVRFPLSTSYIIDKIQKLKK